MMDDNGEENINKTMKTKKKKNTLPFTHVKYITTGSGTVGKVSRKWKSRHLLKRGFEYFSWQEFPHHCTDGPNCEIAYIWSKEQMTNILTKNGFKIIKHKKAHFPVLNRYKNFELFLAKIFGFYRFLWCK